MALETSGGVSIKANYFKSWRKCEIYNYASQLLPMYNDRKQIP